MPTWEVRQVLSVENINVFYGKAIALKNVSLHVDEGEFVSLLGGNGAGKSTLLKTVSGILRPREGRISLDGKVISTLPPHQIVERGIVHIPEGRELFPELTVYENLWMGAYIRKDLDGIRRDLSFVYDVFPRLKERTDQLAGTLSGGEAQMLAIGRGLLSSPRYLMLDEPSLGIAPNIRDAIFETLKRIHKEKGIPVLLVEQNAMLALKMSTRAYVFENGEVRLEGKAEELSNNSYVKEVYLGY
jgi:branched-chain amino acid transport system ATP-binding protein